MKYGYLREYSIIDILTNFNLALFVEKIIEMCRCQ